MNKNVLLGTTVVPHQKLIDFYEINMIGIQIPISELPVLHSEVFSHFIFDEKEGMKQGELKSVLSTNRLKYHLISVNTNSAKIASIAARDGRVDAVWLDSKKSLKVFNVRFARRLKENNKFIILDLSPFFNDLRASEIRNIVRILDAILKVKVPILLTNRASMEQNIRHYRSLQAIARVLGVNNNLTNPDLLLERISENVKKITGGIIFPGIELEGDE